MGGGNVNTWHNHMYVDCKLIEHNCCFSDTFKIVLK